MVMLIIGIITINVIASHLVLLCRNVTLDLFICFSLCLFKLFDSAFIRAITSKCVIRFHFKRKKSKKIQKLEIIWIVDSSLNGNLMEIWMPQVTLNTIDSDTICSKILCFEHFVSFYNKNGIHTLTQQYTRAQMRTHIKTKHFKNLLKMWKTHKRASQRPQQHVALIRWPNCSENELNNFFLEIILNCLK